jgi:hypothetical protein
MKKQLIINYLNSIDWTKDWSTEDIKKGIREITNEEPAISLGWKTFVSLNEKNVKEKREIVESITITYTEDVAGSNIPMPKKITIII